MKLIAYQNGVIKSIENITGVRAFNSKEITVIKTDTYEKRETLLDGRSFMIAPDSDACLALAAAGVDPAPLHTIILTENL